jgi:AIPR protein
MELDEFLRQTQAEVRGQNDSPYPELAFAEVVMQHMAEVGMTFEPVVCHYLHSGKGSVGTLRLSGYAVSEDADQIDLFVSLYEGVDVVTTIPDSETKNAADQCLRFFARAADGSLLSKMDPSSEAYGLVLTIKDTYQNLDQIRIYVLTDRQAKSKNFKSQEVKGKTIKLEVMDIERLYRHWSSGKPRDELVVNFDELSGGALPCVYVPGEMADYDYAMTAIPGEALRFIYEKYGARLLEANVRSFLSVTGKVNRGIRDTLKDAPERFMAYNNGIVLIADEVHLGKTAEGVPGILWIKGMQIVNGGQTTASIYFSQKRNPAINLRKVRVPAKIIILKSTNAADEEALISDISKFANSQNAVKQSDLSANKPYHVQMERLSLSTYTPDGIGRWFYERAAGSYNTMLAREGSTPAKLRSLKQTIPPARKFTKTDLAKFINTWNQLPHLVALGSQKNFERFMENFKDSEDPSIVTLPNVVEYKQMIAKAIIFKEVQKLVRPMFPAFQANVAVYTIAVLSAQLGDRMELDLIWTRQIVSSALKEQVQVWAREVNDVLHTSSNGRMISEWAKKPECWTIVSEHKYSRPQDGIPELRSN